ncbi:DNA methyltransferase [Roseateles chitinivorans]|uniref:DNA methyltransferase n=1 Tax=Roseateles chitinivorans TaxID=2917965 RepID=A0A2G9C8N6_9BURK|nr:DNA adenine methylase [Roseateles chitinivorans]PIM51909.1 DNA methyltransferase [Roseateles chitinivorans]
MTEITRPALRYHGGKFRLAPWILGFFPPHKVYVEPFGGGASVLAQKEPAPTEVYNDLDSRIVRLFRVLRDPAQAAELARRLELTPFSREEYEGWCYEEPVDEIDAAHQVVARGFMGQSSKGIWQRSGLDTRINPDGYCSRINALRASPEAVRTMAKRLAAVLIEHDDAHAVMRRHDREDALFYLDPPYLTAQGRGTHIYTHDFTIADHRRLAETAHALKAMVVISGYPSDLYDQELFAGWERHERKALADGARERTEVVWLNPACSRALYIARGDLFAEQAA